MRPILIFSLFFLLSCSPAIEPQGLIFIDSNAFLESCEVQASRVILDFEHQQLSEENRRIFHRSVYQLEPDLTLDIIFTNKETSDGLTDIHDDRMPDNIDTLSLNQDLGEFRGKRLNRYFVFSKDIDFGYVYCLFDFGEGAKTGEEQELFEYYQERMVFEMDYQPPMFEPFEPYDPPLKLANGIAVIGKQSFGSKTHYALLDQSTPVGGPCDEVYLYYYQLLSSMHATFQSGDQIAIYTEIEPQEVNQINQQIPHLQMLVRGNSGLTESNFAENNFDCIYYKN